jgi:AcrR family transcriptional regulator
MPSSRARAARKPADDRRREIADAALRVIAAGGLRRFTAVALAREVRLSDAALFRHFPSKEAIVDAAVDRVEELLFAGFPPQAADPVDRLGAFFAQRVAVLSANPGISALLMSEELAKAGTARTVARVATLRRRSLAFVRACVDEARERGRLRPGLGAEEASVVVVGALLALAHVPGAAEEPISSLAPRVWGAIDTLLRTPPTGERS